MAHEWMRGRRLKKKVGAKIGTRQLLGAVGEASIDLRGVLGRRRKKREMLATMTMLRENAHSSQDVCTGQAAVLVGNVSRLLSDGRLAGCECSNLKRIEHHTCGHGGSGFGAMVREVVSC